MSGGAFDYQEYRLEEIAEDLYKEAGTHAEEHGLTIRQQKRYRRLATHLKDLRRVLREVDYALCGDTNHDTCEERCREFFQQHID